MNDNCLEIRSLNKSFNGLQVLSNFSCTVKKGEILGLIGPNGAGKTTLFNVVTGFIEPDQGFVKFNGENIIGYPPHRIFASGIVRTFQNLRLIGGLSVVENLLLSFRFQRGEHLRHMFFNWRSCSAIEKKNYEKAISLLHQISLSKEANSSAENLSYGQQKLLSLACCLATDADIFLLDEPVAGIAPEMIERILTIINDLPGLSKSVILIEHNLDVIMQVCDRVIFMDTGVKVSEGTPKEIRNDPKVIEAYLD